MPDVHGDLITGLERLDDFPQLFERSKREMCPHAEAQLAHDGALSAVAEGVFDDAA